MKEGKLTVVKYLKTRIPTIYTYTLSLYLLSLLFTYPYGIEIISTKSIRPPDIFSIICVIIGFLSFIYYKPKVNVYRLLPLLIFLSLEIILPVFGALIYGPITAGVSGGRIFLLYAPLLLFSLQFREEQFDRFDQLVSNILKFAIIANVIYCIIQLAAVTNLVPEWLVFTRFLAPWAADGFFHIEDGLRASGFFTNTLQMSGFGIVGMSYFLAKYTDRQRWSFLCYGALSFLLVLMSTARVAYLAAFLIIILCLVSTPRKTAIKIITFVALIIFFLCLNVHVTVGIDSYFQRFLRLADGLAEDYSFSQRFNHLWPNALEVAQEYPIGTLIQPTHIINLIDSGYITYYAQGKWLFLLALLLLLFSTGWYAITSYMSNRNWYAISTLGVLIFILLDMVTHNPMRSPFIIFLLVYGISLLQDEKDRIPKFELKQ